ncbi:hypothetical protein ABZX69_38295 [Streptomyces sp. NPDC004074]|uniref:hypothetical protein n=1 Tax=unclassified Streptomyces TaxID=2593676 RepID=UPI0033B658A5
MAKQVQLGAEQHCGDTQGVGRVGVECCAFSDLVGRFQLRLPDYSTGGQLSQGPSSRRSA